MTAHELAEALGGRREGHEHRCRCPIHGGRSLSVRDRDGKVLIVCRAGCPQGDLIKALREMGLWGGDASYEPPPVPVPPPDDTERRADRASELWNEAHPIKPGDPVHTYLKNRGITLPEYPSDLRCHPHLDYWTQDDNGKPVRIGSYPAMIAVVRSPQGRPVALHRTYLAPDGSGKATVAAPKKILKVHGLEGSAVRLFETINGKIGLAEGIETAISAYLLTGIPCWSCLSAGGIERAVLPVEINRVVLFGDRDIAGMRAVLRAQERFVMEGRQAEIRLPEKTGTDWNDILKENARQGVTS